MEIHNFYISNFVYFTFNFPHGFIQSIFGKTPIGNHLQEKFDSYCNGKQNSALAVLKLFTEMSDDNQEIFINWLNENYCYSKSKKQEAIKSKGN